MTGTQGPGPLMIVGGAEEKRGNTEILREFVRLSGDEQARIVVMTAASELHEEVGAQYISAFNRLGVAHVRTIDILQREDAGKPWTLEAIEQATGVFFTGGNQMRITRLLGGTRLDELLHRRQQEGMTLGGTSAGAAMMSGVMIVGDIPDTTMGLGMVKLGPGMEFINGVLIDQHFEQRGRLRRLLSAVAQYPHYLGLGIDENTALVVRQSTFRVLGEGAVTIVDMGDLSYTNLPDLNSEDEMLALSGVRLHILPSGFRFDLTRRVLILDTEQKAHEEVK